MDVAIGSDGIFSQVAPSGVIPIWKSSMVSSPSKTGGFDHP